MKALIRTTDPEVRKFLPVPYEVVLHYESERHGTLPCAGGLLDQPHLLMSCFRIIEDEVAQAEAERRRLAEINREQLEMWKKTGNKS